MAIIKKCGTKHVIGNYKEIIKNGVRYFCNEKLMDNISKNFEYAKYIQFEYTCKTIKELIMIFKIRKE